MGISRGNAARNLTVLMAAVIALCGGCSGKDADSQSPKGTETAQAQPGPEEKERGTALQAEDSNKGGLTKHQQELVEKVYQESVQGMLRERKTICVLNTAGGQIRQC